jgi:hypothetical protein
MPPNLPQLVKDLHAAYESRTTYTVTLNMMRERMWVDWLVWSNYTWTVEDLARVIGYLRRKIAKGDRNEGALKFGNLIGQPDHFEEDLALAREEASKSPFKPRPRPASLPEAREDAPETAPLDPAEAAASWREQFGRKA